MGDVFTGALRGLRFGRWACCTEAGENGGYFTGRHTTADRCRLAWAGTAIVSCLPRLVFNSGQRACGYLLGQGFSQKEPTPTSQAQGRGQDTKWHEALLGSGCAHAVRTRARDRQDGIEEQRRAEQSRQNTALFHAPGVRWYPGST